jgi:iron(III) transport system substrate-binding protein
MSMPYSRAVLRSIPRVAALLFAGIVAAAPGAHADNGEVNVYSYREPGLISPLLEAFTKETGIEANVIFAKNGLIERMSAEGKNSPADLLLTNDSGLLLQAADAGVTQPAKSEVLEKAIPAQLRDPQGNWFGLTRRARVVYASKDRVKLDAITYEDLADPKWRNRICIRSGQHTYNVALIASMIAHHGEAETETWLTGLRDNLARRPAGGDREGVRDVKAGLCDLAIGNTYYMAAMLKNPEQKEWADAVRMIFPNEEGRGTHVNISGVSLAANAPNKKNALKLMEFLVSPEAQRIYAEANGEYPVVAGVAASPLVQSWGELKADDLPLTSIAELRKKASELVDRVQFDQGPNF